jgi:hypothetical protein
MIRLLALTLVAASISACGSLDAAPPGPAAQPIGADGGRPAFHFVTQSSPWHWDSILAAAGASGSNVVLVSSVQPPQVSAAQWAAYRSYRNEPQPTADDVAALLDAGAAYVMLEELRDDDSARFFVALANDLRARFPQHAGRWGAFVAFGHYARWTAAIDALLDADAVLSLELYPRASEYCASGATGGARDAWLARTLDGDASVARVKWLVARRANRGSASVITPLLGVGDVLLDVAPPAKFLDRVFYVWATRMAHPELLAGAGAYKWQRVAETPLGYGVSNTSRDLAFTKSVEHYVTSGARTSRLGPVPCQ